MSRIQERISTLVRSQLPEFVQSDYTTFTSFLEYYYQFLEQDQEALEIVQNARQYSDIDKTASSFINYFLTNYSSKLPVSLLVNKPLLIKNLRDLYTSKGSELSFKILFKILFNTDVSISYPFENILRASDGNWEQLVSIRVRRISGNATDIKNRFLSIKIQDKVYTTPIIRVVNLQTDLYEIYIPPSTDITFNISDTVYVETADNDIIFTGTVDPTATSYSVQRAGIGFKVGQIFTVNIAGAVGTVIQVTAIDINGGISAIKFISYGYNFTDNVQINIDATKNVASSVQSFVSSTGGFLESGTIYVGQSASDPNRYFFSDYMIDTELYTGELLASFSTNSSVTQINTTGNDDPNIASIIFNVGAVSRYPGAYLNNRGFISEPDIRLQDSLLYQPFAYQTNTDQDITVFYDTIKKLIHPAGQSLFNNRILQQTVNITSNVNISTTSNVFEELESLLNISDINTKSFYSLKTDSISLLESNVYTLYKPVTDSIINNDTVTKQVNVSYADATSTITDETATVTVSKIYADNLLSLSDTYIASINKLINNTDDTVSFIESVIMTSLDYAEAGYFAETYAGTTTTLL